MDDAPQWLCKPFGELTAGEVYDLLALRCAVFVVEQECPYLDPDGLDRAAWHWLYREGDRLLAYQRCLAPGVSYPDASAIGRIVVDRSARGRCLSGELLRRGIDFNRRTWPEQEIRIGAQAHLRAMYESRGFAVCSDPYLEDGIPHVHMRYLGQA